VGIFYLNDGTQEAIEQCRQPEPRATIDSQRKAVALMKSSVMGDINLAAVQGPPGTGKTSVVETFAYESLPEFINGNKGEIILYVAPTNYLVYDAYKRILARLLQTGFNLTQACEMIRVYGSKIKPYRNLGIEPISFQGSSINATNLSGLMGQMDGNVRIVLATEFQRISKYLADVRPKRVHYVADESSKTPYFRIFLPLAEKIARDPSNMYPSSLLVLGDPQQAISVAEEYKNDNVPLLIRLVNGLLRKEGEEVFRKQWVMLDTTFRLPTPSDAPISFGFYGDKLRGHYSVGERIGIVRDAIMDNHSKIIETLENAGIQTRTRPASDVLSAIEEGVASSSPIIVLNTESFAMGDTFDQNRVKLAFLASAIYQIAASQVGYGFSVASIAPYCDIADTVHFRYRRFGGALKRPRSTTVQSLIGGEASVVVASLGKEWDMRSKNRNQVDESFTIYGREPELLNVQFSRHRSQLIVIGNVERLKELSDQRVQKTVTKMLDMEGKGTIISRLK